MLAAFLWNEVWEDGLFFPWQSAADEARVSAVTMVVRECWYHHIPHFEENLAFCSEKS